MVANLFPDPFDGIGGETQFIESHLLDGNGRVRDLADVGREIGDGTAQLAYLEYQLRERMRTPTARGYPPKVFFSYRRETPEHVTWCVELARALEAAGYEVMLDALALTDAHPSAEQVGTFIGQLAAADVVLVVLTRSYVGDDHSMRDWLYEEWLRIRALRTMGLLEIIGVARDKDVDRSKHVAPHNILDLVIDVSELADETQRQRVLDFFGTYRGPRLTAGQASLLAQEAHDCIEKSMDRDEAAAAHLARIEPFPDTEEFRLAEVAYTAAFRTADETIRLAAETVQHNLTLSGSMALSESLWFLDFDRYAFPVLTTVAESPSRWRVRAHYLMADILWRQNYPRAARNHLTWCLTEKPRDHWEEWGELGEEARTKARGDIEVHDQEIARRERVEWPEKMAFLRPSEDCATGLDRQCDVCQARFWSGGMTCSLCGTIHPRGTDKCGLCEFPTLAWENLTFCPVCRRTFKETNGGRGRVMVVPRGPGEWFSVLWPQAKPSPFR